MSIETGRVARHANPEAIGDRLKHNLTSAAPQRERGLWTFLTWSFFLSQLLAAQQLIGTAANTAEAAEETSQSTQSSNAQSARVASATVEGGSLAPEANEFEDDDTALAHIGLAFPPFDRPTGPNSGHHIGPSPEASPDAAYGVRPLAAADLVTLPATQGEPGFTSVPSTASPTAQDPGGPRLLDPILDPIEDVVEDVVGLLDPVIDDILSPVGDTVDDVIAALAPLTDAVLDLTGDVVGDVGDVTGALAPVVEAVGEVVETLEPVVEQVVAPAVAVVGDAGEALAPVVEAVAAPVGEIAETLSPVVASATEPVVEAVGEVVETLEPVVEQVVAPAVAVVGDAGEALAPVVEAVAAPVGEIAETLSPVAPSATEPVVDVVASSGSVLLEGLPAVSSLDDLFSGGGYTQYGLELQVSLEGGELSALPDASIEVSAQPSQTDVALQTDLDGANSVAGSVQTLGMNILPPSPLEGLGLRGVGDLWG